MTSIDSETKDEDSTCVLQMLNRLRSGTSGVKNRPSGSSVISRLKFDTSLENTTPKRALSDENISSPLKKFKEYNIDSTKASPWEMHRIQADLWDARAEISMLENRIAKLHAVRVEMEVAFESEKQTLLELQDRDRNKIKELEKRLKTVRRHEMECKDELVESKKAAECARFKLESTINILQKENAALKDKIDELGHASHKSQVSNERQTCQLEAELGEAIQELVELRDRNSDLELRIPEITSQLLQAEQQAQALQQAQFRIKELEHEQELHRDAMNMAKSQQYKLLHYPELEKEVTSLREELKHLREAVPQKLLLEEMVQDLQSRQSHLEESEQQLAQMQAIQEQLEKTLEEWQLVAKDHCEKNVEPAALRQYINELQQQVLVLTADIAQLQSQLKSGDQNNEALLLKLDKMKQQAEKQQGQHEQQMQLVRRLQKKLLLISRERDSYRSQLDSYEKDLTLSSSSALLTSQYQQQRMRIESLEKTVEGYRDMVERLETELEKGNNGAGTTDLLDKISRLESERDLLLHEKEQLKQRRDELEQQIECYALKGDVPITSKLLHFRLNPTAEAEMKKEEEFADLQAECDRLRARVKVLEDGNMADITLQANEHLLATNSREIQELREQVKSGELKIQRLMEVFKTSSHEFRDACYQLLGYKIDRLQTNHYRFTSMYADSPEDYLMFKVLPNGEAQLLESELSGTLTDLVDLHLQQQNSFPMFLCAVNLLLYNRQTMVEEPILIDGQHC